MHGDGGIDQIASQRSEAGKCPLLVGPGKLAESDDIRRKKAASFRVSAMAVPSHTPDGKWLPVTVESPINFDRVRRASAE